MELQVATFLLLLLLLPYSGYGKLLHGSSRHRLRRSPPQPSSSSSDGGPDIFFEVARPVGGSYLACSALVVQHAFANTYSVPPAIANYTGAPCKFDQVVLKWSGTCKGRQYDRISAVWFGGVEVLRTCTAEPTSRGIYWEVRKDVSRFSSVFRSPQIVAVELANVVDETYTGIFNINITLEFYRSPRSSDVVELHGKDMESPVSGIKHQGNQKEYMIIDVKLHESDRKQHQKERHASNLFCQHCGDHGSYDDAGNVDLPASYRKVDDLGNHAGNVNHYDTSHNDEATASVDVQLSYDHLDQTIFPSDPVAEIVIPITTAPHSQSNPRLVNHGGRTDDANVVGAQASYDHSDQTVFPTDSPADIIIPISSSDPLSGGYWFEVTSENDTVSSTFEAPTNIYRAVLEVCVSFHGNDEFWYTNPPNEYLEANDLSGYPGNGPFREVQVFLDDYMVGAAWPFPVIFTGGINPLYWRPAAAIGAYNLPSYDIELTPFIGLLVDGSNHTISFRVKNADGSWPLDANLHLWLDPSTSQTMGGLVSYDAPLLSFGGASQFDGLDGTFQTTAGRSISFSGYVISTLGDVLTTVSYAFSFDHTLVYQNSSAVQMVNQETKMKAEITSKTTTKVIFSHETTSTFPFSLYSADYSSANSIYTEECNLTNSFNQESSIVSLSGSKFETLSNSQSAGGYMTVVKNTVTAGVGALKQDYDFESTSGCFERSLSTRNYSILFDATDFSCERYAKYT